MALFRPARSSLSGNVTHGWGAHIPAATAIHEPRLNRDQSEITCSMPAAGMGRVRSRSIRPELSLLVRLENRVGPLFGGRFHPFDRPLILVRCIGKYGEDAISHAHFGQASRHPRYRTVHVVRHDHPKSDGVGLCEEGPQLD